ncbi:MAG: diphosphomevalonate decarboxylase [Lentisphaerae bacterium]|nr:diphosphomevalonate decarboxylase [Lentisphaerota bacterium]
MSKAWSRQSVVEKVIGDRKAPAREASVAFAPANIALCKYWGKRNEVLNLPVTSSLSISLGALGSHCRLSPCSGSDQVTLGGETLEGEHPFVERIRDYLNLFRPDPEQSYKIEAINTVPTAAGFASSASGFAALVLALDGLHGWGLSLRELSILARLGSGSACRSLWQGLVEWHVGSATDGMDSYGEPLGDTWDELRVGLLVLEAGKKPIGSRPAMKRTVETSPGYAVWPDRVAHDLANLKAAIAAKDFERLGEAAESNALAMHATMIMAQPPVLYWKAASVTAMNDVWAARRDGVSLYFTMDAGPNIKLLFTAADEAAVVERFPALRVTAPALRPAEEA